MGERPRSIGSEEDAVRILAEKFPRRVWSAPQFTDPSEVDSRVEILLEPLAHRLQIFGVVGRSQQIPRISSRADACIVDFSAFGSILPLIRRRRPLAGIAQIRSWLHPRKGPIDKTLEQSRQSVKEIEHPSLLEERMLQQDSVDVSGVRPAEGYEQFAHCEDAEHVSGVPHRLPQEVVKRLSRLNAGYVLFVIAVDWALIITAVWLAERYWHPVFYTLAVIYIGARIHGLAVLVHDAAHYRLLSNKKANDLLSDLLLGFPIVLPTHFYRATRHFAHHRNIGLPDDPHIWQTYHDKRWVFPKTRLAFTLQMLECMLHGPKDTIMRMYHMFAFRLAIRSSVLLPILYYGTVAALVISLDLGMVFLCYWLAPLMFVFPLIYNFRLMAEHMGISKQLDKIGAGTRTTLTNRVGQHLIAPHNVNYHLEHHRYPSVPFFRLPELHKVMIDYSGNKEELHITHGYWRVMQALTTRD